MTTTARPRPQPGASPPTERVDPPTATVGPGPEGQPLPDQDSAQPPARHAARRRGGGRRSTYAWTWALQATPEQLWPLLADTNRFDRVTGVPPVSARPAGDGDGPRGTQRATTRQHGVRLDYVQEPWEWQEPDWFSVRRRFERGPLTELDVHVTLEPGATGGTTVRYVVTARARHAVLAPAIPIQIGWRFARRFAAAARRFDELALAAATDGNPGAPDEPPSAGSTGSDPTTSDPTTSDPTTCDPTTSDPRGSDPAGTGPPDPGAARSRRATARQTDGDAERQAELHRAPRPVPTASGPASALTPTGDVHLRTAARRRLDAAQVRLVAAGADPGATERLVATVAGADDAVVDRLRPHELADAWGLDRGTVLDTCLQATRAGLVELRWELLCPSCRVAGEEVARLADLPESVHCETCRIDVTVDFARGVELVLRPSAGIRPAGGRRWCVGGPRHVPHQTAQVLVDPGGARTIAVGAAPGRWRLRSPGVPGTARLLVVPGEGVSGEGVPADGVPGAGPDSSGPTPLSTDASPDVVLDEGGWPGTELVVAAGSSVRVVNRRRARLAVVLERTDWADQAVTAAEVASRRGVRDLVDPGALHPRRPIAVGSLTVAFTDLRGSTAFYQEVGDAVAFGRVVDHFALVQDCVQAEGGTVVKTIGDAVMATFVEPSRAVRAMAAAQRGVDALPGLGGARLKVGLHTGPCIAVTLDDRLDYFGSAVNLAARLCPCSDGTDLVVSSAVRHDPLVAELLADGWDDDAVDVTLKGFDGAHACHRLRPPPS